MPATLDGEALAILRGFPNPFADIVRPQYADRNFADIHVPEISWEAHDQLVKAIDSFRVDDYSSAHSLPPSAAVTVIGPRGAGKTHLLESIQHQADKPQLIVVRKTDSFQVDVPFEEYLFQMLIDSLQEPHLLFGVRLFDAVAAQLTRLILLQTLRSLSAPEKLFALQPEGRTWYRFLLWGAPSDTLERFALLANELENNDSRVEDVRQLARRHELAEVDLSALALSHLRQTEKGADPLSIMRRELYSAMVRATLNNDTDALNEFLEADYRPANVRTIYRADAVRHLLFVLCEACALVKVPIVFAFDNLEGLLAPSGAVLEARAKTFFEGIAQAIDHFRGFLFLVFAEEGLYREVAKFASTFARDRLARGVSLAGRPPLARLDLQPANGSELQRLIVNRMKPIRAHLKAGLPETFPFPAQLVADMGKGDQPIRKKLELLGADYNQIVFGAAPPSPRTDAGPAAPASAPDLEPPPVRTNGATTVRDRESLSARAWDSSLSKAGAKLDTGSTVALNQALVQSLGELLKTGFSESNGVSVDPCMAGGDDNRYGYFSLKVSLNGPPSRVALGFLLAGGTGMAGDLQTKFAAFDDDRIRATHLVVLWYTLRQIGSNPVAALPPATRKVWDAGAGKNTILRKVNYEDIRKILAFPTWRDEVKREDAEFPIDMVVRFVNDKCQSILRLVSIGKAE